MRLRYFISKAGIEVEKSKKVSEDEFSELIRKLSENIANNKCELEKKKCRLSAGEIHDREFEISTLACLSFQGLFKFVKMSLHYPFLCMLPISTQPLVTLLHVVDFKFSIMNFPRT